MMLRPVVNMVTCARVALAISLLVGPVAAIQMVDAQVAAAQDPSSDSEDPGESRATEFRAMEGPDTESVPGGALLVGAYAIVWGFLMIYVLRLGKLQQGLAKDMERLERSFMDRNADGDDEGGE